MFQVMMSSDMSVVTDEQTMAALQATTHAAQVAIQQLQEQQGIHITEQGQHVYVVTDPAQLEALQVRNL